MYLTIYRKVSSLTRTICLGYTDMYPTPSLLLIQHNYMTSPKGLMWSRRTAIKHVTCLEKVTSRYPVTDCTLHETSAWTS